ncbi:MAG: 5-formyltetrahydrofolate cyclo-ligase [Pseudomonadales bacterium]|jgi:5-formyltetrahydrofolate cyclo-ligase
MSRSTPRWTGRHSRKDQLRARIWSELESSGNAIGTAWFKIPDFVGAAEAAAQLIKTAEWQNARVVKCNPDAAQAPLRLAALRSGKTVYTPIPELVRDFPYLCLEPAELSQRGIDPTDVAFSEGAGRHGRPCTFAEVQPIDFFVVGCVAVTAAGGRTGKGAGFADLEFGIFNSYGQVSARTPIATTVHDVQLVSDDSIVMENHDAPLDIIATPTRLLRTFTTVARPGAVDWDRVRDDQFASIPFLADLRDHILQATRSV